MYCYITVWPGSIFIFLLWLGLSIREYKTEIFYNSAVQQKSTRDDETLTGEHNPDQSNIGSSL